MPWPVLPWWPKAWNPFSRWTWANSYDYETLLDSLEKEIQSTESTLTDIRARKRRAIHNVLQIMITLWIISLIVLWVFSSFFWGQEWAASRSLVVVLLLLGTPLFIAILHRVVSIWFRRLERAQESHLGLLRKQKREKINEIKKATDFDHLRSLLDRYDDEKKRDLKSTSTDVKGTNVKKRASMFSLRRKPSKDKPAMSQSTTESRAEQPKAMEALAPPITGLPVLGVPSAQAHLENPSLRNEPSTQQSYPRGWMDKVADMILGTDPYGATPEDQQYALICRHCFHHNGLVPKNELHETQYICPYCFTFNSRRPSSRPVSSPFAPVRQDSSFSEQAEPLQSQDDTPAPETVNEEGPALRRSSRLREQLLSPDDEYDEGAHTDDMQLDE